MITRTRINRFLGKIHDLREDLASIERGEKKNATVMSELGNANTNLLLAGNAVVRAAEEKKK